MYNLKGQLIAEYGGTAQSPGATSYLTADQLGSTRVITGSDKSVKFRDDCLPFGQEIGNFGVGRGSAYSLTEDIQQRFTGKMRDQESSLDYALTRYCSSAHGRFISADEVVKDTSTADPESWNLYAYVRNNPERYIDPNGDLIYVGGLTAEEQQELLRRINATYGANVATVDSNGYLQVDTSQLSAAVQKATQFLTDAINSDTYFASVIVTNNDKSVAFGESIGAGTSVVYKGVKHRADLIKLDFGDDQWVGGDDEARTTFLNTVFAHEVAHRYPEEIGDPTKTGETGPVVDKVNAITDALGLPSGSLLRVGYLSSERHL